MSDEQVRTRITADANQATAEWGRLGAKVESVARSMSGALGGMVSGLQGQIKGIHAPIDAMQRSLAAVAAVAAAGVGVKKLVSEAAAMTEAAMDMARALGTTTNEASAARAALEDVGATPDEFTAAAKGMSKQLKTNEADLQAMGLATRDASGNLRPMTDLMLDGIAVLNGYREGADRNIAAQTMFGKGVDTTSKLLLLSRDAFEENREAVAELGLEVGANSVAAWQAFDAASDRASLSVRGVANAAGQSLMPAVTDIIRAFNATVPAAIVVVRGALGGLTAGFLYVKNGVVVLWETINAFVISVAEPLRAVTEAVGRSMVGDFSGAATVLRGIAPTISGAWETAMQRMLESSADTSKKVAALFENDSAAGSSGGAAGSKTVPPKKPQGGAATAAAPSMMAYYEAALEEQRHFAAQSDALHGMSKEKELEFWRAILADTATTAAERVAIARKTSALEVAILTDKAKETQALDSITVAGMRDTALARIDLDEQTAQTQAALGRTTQAQLLAQELQFEDARAAIKNAALAAQAARLDPDRDVVAIAQINAQIQALELAHQQRMATIRGQAQIQSAAQINATWQDAGQRISGLWDKGVQAMMNGTFTWRNATKAAGAELVGWFSGIVKRQVADWLFGENAKTGATAMGTAARWTMEALAAAKSVALWAATAVKNIMTSAWEAMAGAWKAVVGIPYIGPALAVGAAAAAFAGVAAIASHVSAAGGYDIPAGVNPMVQAHAKEMILPETLSSTVRDMAAVYSQVRGSGGGGGGDLNLNVRGASVGDFFLLHKSDLVKAMKAARRDGHF